MLVLHHVAFFVAGFESIRPMGEGSRMGNLSKYLRFSPDEYRLLAGHWHQLDLGGRPRTDFKRLLVEALSDPSVDTSSSDSTSRPPGKAAQEVERA